MLVILTFTSIFAMLASLVLGAMTFTRWGHFQNALKQAHPDIGPTSVFQLVSDPRLSPALQAQARGVKQGLIRLLVAFGTFLMCGALLGRIN